MHFIIKKFEDLSIKELYDILQIRAEVFVVEQNCVYQDLDNKDQYSYHIFHYEESKIIAYLRVVASSTRNEVSIGRVLTGKRGYGLGLKILQEGIRVARDIMGAEKIYLSAQVYAIPFYQKAGFVQCSEEYLEDNIPHVKMLLECVVEMERVDFKTLNHSSGEEINNDREFFFKK